MCDENELISNKVNETALFMKYKSTYTSAFLDLSKHALVMYCLFYLMWYFKNSVISLAFIPIVSMILNRTFIVFHDCCHNSYTQNQTLNYIIAHITGMLVVTSPNWILDHHTHHLTNGNIENEQHYYFNETVIMTKQYYLKLSTIVKTIVYMYKQPYIFFTIVPLIYFGIFQRFIYIEKKLRNPLKYTQSLTTIVFNHVINNIGSFCFLYSMYHVGLAYHYAACFVLSSSMAFMMFHNQHTYNPAYIANNGNWTQRNSGLKGSSFVQIPYYMKYFYMGIEYHHIHHMNSKIPGYNLQKYHEEVSSMFENIHTIKKTEFYNNLWLVLYDIDKSKYITFDELESDKESSKCS